MSWLNPPEAINSKRRPNQTLMLILPSLILCHVKGMNLLGQPKEQTRGLGWTKTRTCNKLLRQISHDHVNEVFQQLMITPNYLATRNRFWRMMKNFLLKWWRLMLSPARSHESLSMELSWTWEPTYKEGAWKHYPGKRSLYCVFSRNMGRWS